MRQILNVILHSSISWLTAINKIETNFKTHNTSSISVLQDISG